MKKLVLSSLLIAMLLVTLMPTAAFAAKPADVLAGGIITGITEGDVHAAGNSGRWVVANRELSGVFTAGSFVNNPYGVPFTLIYHANVDSDQSGNMQGKMTVGDKVLNLNGKSEPVVGPIGMIPIPFPPYAAPLYQLNISGHWNYISGGKGSGTFTATMTFVPTEDGKHVAFVLPIMPDGTVVSPFTMFGK